jgi:hypothetical protein
VLFFFLGVWVFVYECSTSAGAAPTAELLLLFRFFFLCVCGGCRCYGTLLLATVLSVHTSNERYYPVRVLDKLSAFFT